MTFKAASILGVTLAVAMAGARADEILERCEKQMRSYGAAMVKACVDQDEAALAALKGYPAASSPIVARCEKQMRMYGWNMVKACADQDLKAEAELRARRSR